MKMIQVSGTQLANGGLGTLVDAYLDPGFQISFRLEWEWNNHCATVRYTTYVSEKYLEAHFLPATPENIRKVAMEALS